MRVEVPERRSSVEQVADGTRFVIPAKRQVMMLLFLPLWLIGWVAGEVSVFRSLSDGDFTDFFQIAWLALWTFGGAAAIYTWFWTAFGNHIVTLASGLLTVRPDVFGLGVSREYDSAAVRNLRVIPDDSGWTKKRGPQGLIAFDYGAKTIRFGEGIDEAEARMIVEELRARGGFA